MEFDKVIENRRSIRKFKTDKVNEEDILYLLNNARLSPSAHNSQPWYYMIFTDTKKEELLSLISNYITNSTDLTVNQKIMRNCLSFMKEASHIILVYSTLANNTINDYISLGSSIEHICLSATNIGLGTLWLGCIVDFEDMLKQSYNTENMQLISAVVIGYPDESPNARPRKSLSEITNII